MLHGNESVLWRKWNELEAIPKELKLKDHRVSGRKKRQAEEALAAEVAFCQPLWHESTTNRIAGTSRTPTFTSGTHSERGCRPNMQCSGKLIIFKLKGLRGQHTPPQGTPVTTPCLLNVWSHQGTKQFLPVPSQNVHFSKLLRQEEITILPEHLDRVSSHTMVLYLGPIQHPEDNHL